MASASLARKSDASQVIQQYILTCEESFGVKVAVVHSDLGRELKNARFQSFCKEHGIMIHMTAAFTPMQNGTVERSNQTIGDAVRAMLTGGGMEAKHWAEAACSFVQTRNTTPRKCFSGKSAWEMFTGQSPPSLSDFFFGQKVLYWQPRVEREMWDAPRVEARYLSKAVHHLHNSHPGCFRVWD